MTKLLRLALVTLAIVISGVCAHAQHLKFMNIPINGSINQFQQKLKQRGFTPIQGVPLPDGARGFEGKFAGEQAEVIVMYNTSSKTVYQCIVMFPTTTSVSQVLSDFENKKRILTNKYEDGMLTYVDEDNPDPYKFQFLLVNPPVREGSKLIGAVTLEINVLESDYSDDEYYLSISYEDAENLGY